MIATYAIAAVLAAWLLLSVVMQFSESRAAALIKRYDDFALIPIWTFFAPNPGVNDFNVLYRDQSVDGTLSPWRQVDRLESRLVRPFWNPEKRLRKAVVDACSALGRGPAGETPPDEKAILLALPYLLLLNFVAQQPRSDLSIARQFLVVVTDGHENEDEPDVMLASPLHRLA